MALVPTMHQLFGTLKDYGDRLAILDSNARRSQADPTECHQSDGLAEATGFGQMP
jgi:hypothetical protein